MNSARTKVLHVITGLNVGGAETLLCRLIEQTDPARFEHSVVCLESRGTLAGRIEKSGARLDCLGMKGAAGVPAAIWKLSRLIRRQKPDAMHTWMYHADFVGGLASKLAGGPPVAWSLHHADLTPVGMKRSTRMVARALSWLSSRVPARIISCSNDSVKKHAEFGYDVSKADVIFNGADCERFHPDAAAAAAIRAELGIPVDALVIGKTSRFHSTKDWESYCEGVLLLQQRRPDVHVIGCGQGVNPDQPLFQSLLARSPRPENLHILGTRSDMPAIYAAMDLFVINSLAEAFPLSLGEAFACGIPAVATDVGDCREILGTCGRMVPLSDPAALATAIDDLLSLPRETRLAMGAEARRRVETLYSFPATLRRYEQAYEALAALGRTTSHPAAVPATA